MSTAKLSKFSERRLNKKRTKQNLIVCSIQSISPVLFLFLSASGEIQQQ